MLRRLRCIFTSSCVLLSDQCSDQGSDQNEYNLCSAKPKEVEPNQAEPIIPNILVYKTSQKLAEVLF